MANAGRPKGVADKRNLQAIIDVNKRLIREGLKGNYNPLAELAIIGLSEEASIDERIKCHKECAQYFYAKRKAIEVDINQEPDKIENLTDDQLLEIINSRAGSKGTSETSESQE